MTAEIIIVLITILFSAFFSGVEIAFVSSNKLQIELKKKQGIVSARILAHLQDRSSIFIGAMLIGNNIALVVYGIMMARLIEPMLTGFFVSNFLIFVTQTAFSTIVILITAEFLPKSIFKNNANSILSLLAVPIIAFYYILLIPALFITGLASLFLRLFKRKNSEDDFDTQTFGRVDLDNYLQEATKNIHQKDMEHEVQIFQNALEFSNLKARECMIPRTEIVAIDVNDNISELKALFIESELSKILVYRESIDNIIGYVHHFELFKKPKSIKNVLLPIFVVPETMLANEVLEMFIKKQKSIALVVDELGGTSGMLTVEDIVEEIFGEIEDEHDTEELIDKQIDDNDFLFSARLEVDYLNEEYDLNLPDFEGVETLGGLVIHIKEDIPKEGDHVVYNDFVFQIQKVEENRIELIKLHVNS